MSQSSVSPRSEFARGWKPLLGAMALYAGSPVIIAQTASVFIVPIMKTTGLSQTAISIGPVVFITLAIAQPAVAFLINRFGTRVLGLTALVVMLAGLTLLALVPPSESGFLGAGILMGLGGSLGYLATTAQFLSKWFSKNYGLSVGIVGAIGGIVPLILTPILGVVIASAGWKAGYYLIGAFILFICLPLVIGLFREPKVPVAAMPTEATAVETTEPAPGELEGLPAREAAKDPRYWLFTVAFLGVSVAVGGFLGSIVPILISKGIQPTVAATISIGMLLGVMAGRMAGGFLLDRSRFPYLVPVALFAVSGVAAVGMLFANAATPGLLIFIAILLIGASQGAEGDFPAFFFRREFGRKSLATLISWVYLLTTGFAGVGGFIFAGIRDATGGYTAAVIVAISGFALGTVLAIIVAAISWTKNRALRASISPATPVLNADPA